MLTLRLWRSVSTALGIAATIGLIVSALALQDIARGEVDVQNEWWAVRISFIVIALFIATTFLTLARVRRLDR